MRDDNSSEPSLSPSGQTGVKDTSEYLVNDNMTIFYVVASVTAIFLILLICIFVMLYKSRRKGRRLQDLFRLELQNDMAACKSAPISRKTTPTGEKRLSCPNAYGSMEDGAIARSSTCSSLPQFEAENVQPVVGEVPACDAQQFHSFVVGSHPQLTGQNVFDPRGSRTPSPPAGPSARGRVWFTALHEPVAGKLLVTLIRVRGLNGRSEEESSRDPFVRVFLLPDEHAHRTSRIQRKTLNPVYNETYSFDVNEDDIRKQSLRFSVYDVDRRRLRHSLGHVIVPLEELDLMSSAAMWRDLEPAIQAAPSVGEMNVALTYLPHMDRLKVTILRVRNVRLSSDTDTGMYVRLQVCYGKKLLRTKQTLIQIPREELDFNESFSFTTSSKNIEHFNFLLTLMQTTRDAKCPDIELGHVALGSFMYARGDGLIHWQEMLAKTRNVVTKSMMTF
ncbi:SYT15-like protein [Mya arenaria]|uniref:SYT15-like protein n=1 Tax=Mya arenaria TaxID=6604 RepID=A0ABY7DJ77_MYAAR|nr:SYT15-like protein [Mya arenaria]